MARVTNLGSFVQGLKDEMKLVEDVASKVQRKIALDVLTRVVEGTPVDEGRARGNWQADINAVPVGEIDTKDKSGEATIAKGAAKIVGAKFGTAVNIVNNVPYIGRLNDGSSKQAPAGFVEAAIDAAVRFKK